LQTGGDTGYIRDCENTFAQLSSWKRDGKYSTVSDDLEKYIKERGIGNNYQEIEFGKINYKTSGDTGFYSEREFMKCNSGNYIPEKGTGMTLPTLLNLLDSEKRNQMMVVVLFAL